MGLTNIQRTVTHCKASASVCLMNLQVLNERAVAVMQRMSDKLTGRDFAQEGSPATESDSGPVQVQRLIDQATLPENLSASYIGWCPFW